MGSKALFLLLLWLALTLGRGASAQTTTDISQYWPINDGDQKTLVYTDGAGRLHPFTISVTATSASNAVMTENCQSWGFKPDVLTMSLSESDSNTWQLTNIESGGEQLEFDGGINFVSGPTLSNGGKDENFGYVDTEYGNDETTWLVTRSWNAGTVKVPAGTFHFCRYFSCSEIINAGVFGTLSGRTFLAVLAPGVGIIKQSLNPGPWAELVSGTVGGVPIQPMPVQPYAAHYSAIMTDPTSMPVQIGYASISTHPAGTATILYQFSDSPPFSFPVLMSTTGTSTQFTFSVNLPDPMQESSGTMAGTVNLPSANLSASASGTFQYSFSEEYEPTYNETIPLTMFGYTAPTARGSVLPGFTTGTLTFYDLAGVILQKQVKLIPPSRLVVTDPGPDKLVITINRTTGRFYGSFLQSSPTSDTITRTEIGGVLDQDSGSLLGFFLPQNEINNSYPVGMIELTPSP